MSDTTNGNLLIVTGGLTSYTSDSEFTLVKRVQLTNEIPSSSLYALLPSGLQNAFWKYFVGSTTVEYEVPTTEFGGELGTQVMKIVNGTVASDYGPHPAADTTFTSMDVEGVIQPEIDLFLHELYRYLDHLYPDHPDYEYLLTPVELNDAFYAASAIIGYVPDYKFLGTWSQSITGTALTREELKWKIRDLRSAAWRRKFAGSYSGYKTIFSSMYRHGAVYPTATYLPKTLIGGLDVTSGNLFRMFRLIDFLGANDKAYKVASQITFSGIVDPADLYSVYEAAPQSVLGDISVVPNISFGAFIQDTKEILIPSITIGQSNITVQSNSTVPSGYSIEYVIHQLGITGAAHPSSRAYTLIRNGVAGVSPLNINPRPFGNLGNFSFSPSLALSMYPSDALPLTSITQIPFGGTNLLIGDILQDDYIVQGIYPRLDQVVITNLIPGQISIVTNPTNAPGISDTPPNNVLSGGLNIQILQYTASGTVPSHIFLEGVLTYTLANGASLMTAALNILCIPSINPITGEANNRELLLDITRGNYADVCVYSSMSSTWEIVPNVFGWVDNLDYGYAETKEVTRFGNVLALSSSFDPDSFTAWKQRSASEFNTTVTMTTNGTIEGTISSDTPSQIDIISGSSVSIRVEALTAGDSIYGPGLEPGTIVIGSTPNSISITPAAIRSGSFTFNVTMRHSNGVSSIPKVYDFKKTLSSLYPNLSTSVFNFLWPSTVWPKVSLGYAEGVADTSLYTYPTELPPNTLLPSNVYIDRNIFLDLSLDRILYHPNSLGLQGATGQYMCLCDTPWLDYVESFSNQFKRATEQVYVGTQLNLTTDMSGLYSIISGVDYSDSNIQSKVTTFPQYYKANPQPAYIQLGTGGSTKSKLFVSVDDLIRPTIYGAAFYDQTGRDEEPTERRRSTYLQAGNAIATEAGAAIIPSLESPIFEEPIGEYENLIGPAITDSHGAITYTQGLSEPNNTSNTYHTIHSTVYAQQYKNIVTFLGPSNALILNSPAVLSLKRLPEPWTYKGTWSPSTRPIQSDLTLPSVLVPNWPEGVFQDNDYFIIPQSTTVGTYTFGVGDWLVWNSATNSWVDKVWILQGPIAPTSSGDTNISPPDISALVSLGTLFPYYIATMNCYIIGIGPMLVGDWLIAASGPVSNPNWVITTGHCYDTLQNIFYKAQLPVADFTIITQNIINNLESTMFTYHLPRRFLAQGSCDFHFKINPSYNAMDASGSLFSLTAGPILYDKVADLFYVQDTNLDNLDVFTSSGGSVQSEPFEVHTDLLGDNVQLQVQSSVSAIPHYIQFREPQYFKNLAVVIGAVNADNPTQISMVPGFDFPIADISATDVIITSVQVELRNNYSSELENTFFTHYVTLQGMVSSSDHTGKTIVPISGTDTDAAFLSEFASATSHLTAGDQVQIMQPAVARQYDSSYETTYYKNLLAIAGTVSQSDPTTLLPVGTSADDIRAFTDALNLLTPGDMSNGIFTLGGSSFSSSSGIQYQLPFTGNSNNLFALSVACNQSTPLLWVAGGVNGQLAISSDTTTWTTVLLPTSWGASDVRKVYFATTANGVGQWRIVGSNGACAFSINNGTIWIMDPIAGWGSGNINDVSYLPVLDRSGHSTSTQGTWVIVGDNGQTAYLASDLSTPTIQWVVSPLPGSDGLTIPIPANAPVGTPGTQVYTQGWGTATVRAVANGNNVWLIGGGDNITNTSVVGLLARSDNIAPAAGTPAWDFVYLGAPWGNNYVTSIACNNEATNRIWVVTGINGQIAYSIDDGQVFQPGTLPTNWGTTDINNVSYAYGTWTIVGNGGKIATSLDGITWDMGLAPSVLGTLPLRQAAHGTSALGIEHLIIGDSARLAYSNSVSQSQGSLIVASLNQSALAINFNSDIVTWTLGDPTTKVVLLTLYTQSSIECELIGIPTARIPLFALNNQLILPVVVTSPSYTQANRVYYPHLNPNFDLVVPNPAYTNAQVRNLAGYPLYSEDPNQYYTDASGNPIPYKNATGNQIYLCDSTGTYVTSQYDPIPVTSFVNYVKASVTSFSDSRQMSYSPIYSTYSSWIEAAGRLVLGTQTLTTDTITSVTSSSLHLSNAPTLPSDDNILILTIMPTIVTGTTPSIPTPSYPTPGVYKTNNLVTGIYIPDGGYGTWIGYDHTTNVLPWVGDTSAFYYAPLVNANDSPVYLCNADGTFRTDGDGHPIQMQAPKYFTFQQLVTNLGREIDQKGCRGSWVPSGAGNPIEPIYPVGIFESGDYFVISLNLSVGSKVFVKGDWLVWNGSDWIDTPPSVYPFVTKLDTTNNIITFSSAVPLSSGYIRLHVLTLASFDPPSFSPNDSRIVYLLPQTRLKLYTPDRVYYAASTYPSETVRPDLYLNGPYINANSKSVYYSDVNGNYVNSVATITETLSNRTQPQMPKYRLCQEWYKEEQYLEGQESNPYWEFLIIKDTFDSNAKTWAQVGTMNYLTKSVTGTQLVFQKIEDGSEYLSVHQGLQYTSGLSIFEISPTNYIDYTNGVITILMVGNAAYSQAPDIIQTKFEKYGISFISNFELASISSETIVTRSLITSELTSNFYVNTTQNFANTQDKKSSIVSITEMGVFNTNDNMIAYATFPPVIYDSAKHHLSLNVFIKQGEFSTI